MEEQLQTIKNLKQSKVCAYPKCKEEVLAQIMLPVGQLTESNQINFPNENIQSSCQLCSYHTIFAEKGILNLVNINGLVQLFGPYPIVDIVETVLEAKLFQEGIAKALKKKRQNQKTTKNAKSKQTKESR